MKKQTDPPTPTPDVVSQDARDALQFEKLEALMREDTRQDFHRPTRQKHWRDATERVHTDKDVKDKKRRKVAKASVKANRKHANKKRRPSRPKRHK